MLQAINASVKMINNEGGRMLVGDSKASGEAFVLGFGYLFLSWHLLNCFSLLFQIRLSRSVAYLHLLWLQCFYEVSTCFSLCLCLEHCKLSGSSGNGEV